MTPVANDRVPMVPNFGQQPTFVVTIQPSGVHFDPPAPLVLPNSDGLAPGEVTEMYSFDHDLGQFVSIGTGTVSADGSVVASDPGVGIIKGGWHCGGNPASTGTCAHNCDDGNECTDDVLIGGRCFNQPVDGPKSCADGKRWTFRSDVPVFVSKTCNGTCFGSVCVPRHDNWSADKIISATVEALDALVLTQCISNDMSLRDDMLERLRDKDTGQEGFFIQCAETSDTSGGGEDDCASAPIGGNTMTLSNLGQADCPNLALITLHEMVHAVGRRDHTENVADDPVYGCDLSCWGETHVEGADAASCK